MDELVPVLLADGSRLFVRAQPVTPSGIDDEREIAGRMPSIEQVVDAVGGFTDRIGAALRRAAPSKYTVEFECEFALEAGALVAVLGKGSAKTAFSVTVEWERPSPAGD